VEDVLGDAHQLHLVLGQRGKLENLVAHAVAAGLALAPEVAPSLQGAQNAVLRCPRDVEHLVELARAELLGPELEGLDGVQGVPDG